MRNGTYRCSAVAGIVTLLGTIAAPSVQANNLIVNGGFEQPAINGWSLFTTIPGWTATADLIEIGQGAATYGITGATGQVLELDANHNATVQQSLNLSAGTYDLGFDYARRLFGMDGRPANTADFEVLWNGNVVQYFSPTSNAMTHQDLMLTGTNGVNTLGFRGAGTDDSYGALVDNVSLSSVPEPGTWAMLAGFGVAGAGFAGRRLRRR